MLRWKMKNGLTLVKNKDYSILENIPFHIDSARVLRRLYFHNDKTIDDCVVRHLINEMKLLARPCAMYNILEVRKSLAGSLLVEGIEFTNSLLKTNLKDVERIFPYAITCGREVDSLINLPNPGKRYCMAVIRDIMLEDISNYLQDTITRRCGFDYLWQLKPGYLQAWPISERAKLFSILGDVENKLGVKLEEDGALNPASSDCGIFYYSEMEFEACQVCPQEPCMGRRAPYCEQLALKFPNKAGKPCGRRI
jgi:hypothetical protein